MDGLEYCVLDFLSIVPVFHINTQEEKSALQDFNSTYVGSGSVVQ